MDPSMARLVEADLLVSAGFAGGQVECSGTDMVRSSLWSRDISGIGYLLGLFPCRKSAWNEREVVNNAQRAGMAVR